MTQIRHLFYSGKERNLILSPQVRIAKRGNSRKEMKNYFDYVQYWQRNIIESINSSIKRVNGSTCKATITTQKAEVHVRLILHNINLAEARLFHLSTSNRYIFK